MGETWLKCSACRNDLAFGSKYFQCSVSTCNRARTRLVFCSVVCWDSHVATLRHRDAWAEDKIAPTRAAWEREIAGNEPARPSPPPAPRAAAGPAAARPAAPIAVAPDATVARQAAPAVGSMREAESRAVGSMREAESLTGSSTAPAVARRVVGDPAPAPAAAPVQLNDIVDNDILIVVSKLKKYIRERSGMNCSDAVAEVLSDHIRALCDDSIRAAGRDERKTVLDRDVPRPRRP